ncbi:hypothetical protein Tco_0626629 [Tanacetum coccineum]|uniref:Uncharacterized protein n=1 Tax=Tanacetum coccineum TaxID=301880 RepID=A0ABQ4WK32_9ASTR
MPPLVPRIRNGVDLMIFSKRGSLERARNLYKIKWSLLRGNVEDLWDHVKELFHDNEDARAITLDNQLRSIKIFL